MSKKTYKVTAHTTYSSGSRSYVVKRGMTKSEAKVCLASQYVTPSRTFTIDEE